MGHEQKTGISLRGPDENDALTGWRKVIRFRPGKRKAAKVAFNRRVRRRPVAIDAED